MKQLSLSIACFNPQLYHWSWRIRSSIRSMSDYTEDCSSNSTSREDKDYRIIWAHHELVDDRKHQRDSASNARAVIQQRSSLPSKAFVTNSRIHCSSNEECVSASSATLRLQRGFAVHQGTRKVSRKRFVALPFLRESRSRISEGMGNCKRWEWSSWLWSTHGVLRQKNQVYRRCWRISFKTPQARAWAADDLHRKELMSSGWLPLTTVKLAKSEIQDESVPDTDWLQHQKERTYWPATGCASNDCLPLTASSIVLQHHCASHIKKSIVQLIMAILVSPVLISQRQWTHIQSTVLKLSQFFQQKTSKFNHRTVEFIFWGRALIFVFRQTSSTYRPCTSLSPNQRRSEAPDHIIGVNQKKTMSTHCRMDLNIIPKSGNNFKIFCMVLENITDYEHPNSQIAAPYLRKERSATTV